MLHVMEADARDRLRLLHEHLEPAASVDELVAGLGKTFAEFVREALGAHLLLQELGTLAMRRSAIRTRRAQLRAEYRHELADILTRKQREGVIALRDGETQGVAALLIALGEGLASEALADPEWDYSPALAHAATAVTHLLTR